MSKIAIITARGGSKRIPRKNIKDFLGHPIIYYSIKAALDSKIFDHVMVSTDDEEIARISIECGAEVPFMRSEATSNDFAGTNDVLLEVINEYAKRGVEVDEFCCIYPTAPFITPEKLKEAARLLKEKKAGRIIPVVRFSYPPQRGFIINDGKLSFKYPEFETSRSQDLEPIYHDCGQFYYIDGKRFAETRGKLMAETYPMLIPETEVQDIDNEEDWELAEIKYKQMCERN